MKNDRDNKEKLNCIMNKENMMIQYLRSKVEKKKEEKEKKATE